jgi:hypothetical protein
MLTLDEVRPFYSTIAGAGAAGAGAAADVERLRFVSRGCDASREEASNFRTVDVLTVDFERRPRDLDLGHQIAGCVCECRRRAGSRFLGRQRVDLINGWKLHR